MRPLFGVAMGLLCLATAVPAMAADAPLYGFDQVGTARELALEQTFRTVPSAQGAGASIAALAAYDRFAGTWGDAQSAQWMAAQLSGFGWQTSLVPYQAPLESPKRLVLELLAPGHVRFDLRESPDPSDPDVSRPEVGIPFDYGSPDGDVRGPLIYANRGSAADFAALERARVDVKGAIAVVRNGGGYAGNVALDAQRAGALGVIFYSDPADDGAGRGTTLPAGPWRPLGSTQWGTVTTRRPLKIPTLPVAPVVAAALLGAIPGTQAPAAWRGDLPVAYHLGRGGLVHLQVTLRRHQGRLVNVVATLPGRQPGVAIVLGAHRDASAFGAVDDASGIATLMEIGRGLGYLYRAGWRPQRTIVIAGFDGEEIGETGSYAFLFDHQTFGRVAAYVNCDACVSGARFEADGAEPLHALLRESARAIPESGGSTLAQRWNGQVGLPGTAGDLYVFQYLAGTPALGTRFSGPYGVYRSAYDDVRWMNTFGDPGYVRHRELAQLIGTLALRLSDAASLPLRWSAYDASLGAALRRLSLEVKRSDLPIDLQPLRAAVRAFEMSAARADARIARGAMPDSEQLDAAAALVASSADGPFDVVYGEGGAQALLPAIAAPLAADDEARIEWGIRTTTAALRRAADLLSPLPTRS